MQMITAPEYSAWSRTRSDGKTGEAKLSASQEPIQS
jgi:hypothetical protein